MYIKNAKELRVGETYTLWGKWIADQIAVSYSYLCGGGEKAERRTTAIAVRRVIQSDSAVEELQLEVEICDSYENGRSRTMIGCVVLKGEALKLFEEAVMQLHKAPK